MPGMYGLYESWLSPTFFLERGKWYDDADPEVADLIDRFPTAFTDNPAGVDKAVEEATPERRNVRRA